MCVNGRFVYNRFIHDHIFVKCGHCEACLQEKAHKRMMRIYDEVDHTHLSFFVTCTYARDYCPYFRLEDYLNKVNPLPIYRDMKLIRTKGSSKYVRERDLLDEVHIDDWFNNKKLPHLAFRSHCIGVAYFKDFQDFIKRVKIYLKRHYNYVGYFKVFTCTEYGEDTCRPHAHFIITVDNTSSMYEKLRSAVMSSWKMCSADRWKKGFQINEDASSYVSSYVNSPSVVPVFLKTNFKTKHSISKYYGYNIKSFSRDSILEKVRSGNMQYARQINSADVPSVVNLPLPKYVVNRYFPLFKGYSRFARPTLYDVLRNLRRLSEFKLEIDYSSDDIWKIKSRFLRAWSTYFPDISYDDYCLLHIQAWTSYRSTCSRLFLEDDTIPILEKYDNLYELYNGDVRSDIKIPVGTLLDPNSFNSRVKKTLSLQSTFYKKTKRKKVGELITNKIYEL